MPVSSLPAGSRSIRPPTDRPRRDDIEAAIAAYNATGQEPLLTPKAVHLLSVMFVDADICQRNFDSLVREGFGWRTLLRLLRHLTATGFLSKERGTGKHPNTYRLHLPPRRQP
jgi:hypothetical protein